MSISSVYHETINHANRLRTSECWRIFQLGGYLYRLKIVEDRERCPDAHLKQPGIGERSGRQRKQTDACRLRSCVSSCIQGCQGLNAKASRRLICEELYQRLFRNLQKSIYRFVMVST